MANSRQTLLSSGRALDDPAYDKLGYAGFAETLVHGIQEMTPPEGLVIAVYGDWGSGKTTMLNFVEHYIKQIPEDSRPIIVHFNPWWFSGAEDLTRHFFTELRLVLGKTREFGKVLENIAALAEAVSEPTPYAPLVKLGAWAVRKAAKQDKDMSDLKSEITDVLSAQIRKIVIIIDDIDRLTADEIRQLFQVIKAVADFPNVIYLLAFDKNVVIKALEKMQDIPGEAYLEKIVQVPFELPLPSGGAIERLLDTELNLILADTPNELFDATYWNNVFIEGIRHFISTPRDVIRLANTLRVTYPAVRGEVNPVDFIAIETLRVFCPLAYDAVRKNADEFTGYQSHLGGSGGKEVSKEFHESWMKPIQEEDVPAVTSVMTRLFPKFQSAFSNVNYPASWELAWRKELRVCSQAIFPVYFRFTLPEGAVSLADVRVVLSIASNREAFGSKLLTFADQKRSDGTSRVSALLDRLADYAEEFKPESIGPVIQTLFEIGDQLLLPEDDSHGLFGLRNYMRISRLVRYLLRRLGEKERYETLRQSIELGHSVATIVDFMTVLESQQGKRGTPPSPENEQLVTSEHLSELKILVLKKIRDAANESKLVHAPRLSLILAYWRESNADEVRVWVDRLVTNKEAIARLIDDSFLEGYSQSITDQVGKVTYQLDPSLHEILGNNQTNSHVRELLESGQWTGEKKSAVERFLKNIGKSSKAN